MQIKYIFINFEHSLRVLNKGDSVCLVTQWNVKNDSIIVIVWRFHNKIYSYM